MSRYDFACTVLKLAGLPADCLRPENDPEEARTVNLVNLMLSMTGIYTMPTWQDDLHDYMAAHDLLA